MNPYSLVTLFVSILLFFVAFINLIINGRKYYLVSLLSICTFFWQSAWTLLYNTNDSSIAILISRLGHIPIGFIPILILLFYKTVIFPENTKLRVNIFILITTALSLINVFTNLIISGVRKYKFGFYPEAGDLHFLFIIFIIYTLSYIIYAHIKYKRKRISKQSANIILLAILVFSLSGIDFLTNYGVDIYPFGFIFVFIFIILFISSIYNEMRMQILDYTINLEEKVESAKLEIVKQQKIILQSEKLSSLGRMSAGLAHELNNPLAFLKPTMNKLLRVSRALSSIDKSKNLRCPDTKEEEDIRRTCKVDKFYKDIDYIEDKSKTLISKMISIIKDFENFTQKSQRIELFPHDLISIIMKILTFYTEDCPEINFKKNLPLKLVIDCVPHQIDQVITNLLKNSTQSAGVKNIKLYTNINEKYVFLYFEDDGAGISEDVLNKIFDPFFTTKDIGEGTGLGLSISKEIVNNHNGELSIGNIESGGVKAVLKLPRSSDV